MHCTKSGFCFYLAVICPIGARRGGGSEAPPKGYGRIAAPVGRLRAEGRAYVVGSDGGSNCAAPGGGQIESVKLVVCAIQFVQFVIGSDVERGESILRAVELVRSKGRFLRRVGRFFPKAARFGSKSPAFLQKVRRCFPPPRPFSAQRVAVCKKIPRCLPDSGGMSFAARTAERVARSGFSTWRRWGAIA